MSLGLPVPKKQTAILTHLQFRVKLPDHDFPIEEKHKLIPSVYAACQRKNGGAIDYADIRSYSKWKT